MLRELQEVGGNVDLMDQKMPVAKRHYRSVMKRDASGRNGIESSWLSGDEWEEGGELHHLAFND